MTSVERPPALDAVVARMRELGAGLPPADGVAVFNGVYLRVAEEVAAQAAAGAFADDRASAQLAADFAERYLAAVADAAADRRPPACWRPLLQSRGHGGIHPLQFALAGINAHVSHDLPLSLVSVCSALGLDPADVRSDFDRVGDILDRLEERIREELMPGPDLLDVADPLTHLLGVWSLDKARDGAWATARALWPLRGLPEVYGEFAQRLSQSTGLVSRCLLTPLRVPGQR
ncbi:DUF5995 family protein [Streptomyces sp. NPDC051940]|uniref:DUF5995 family protein n=1 Tax=Streptomyces sp. NPDC051940 TaxID=3155675 RepID=UPI003436A830